MEGSSSDAVRVALRVLLGALARRWGRCFRLFSLRCWLPATPCTRVFTRVCAAPAVRDAVLGTTCPWEVVSEWPPLLCPPSPLVSISSPHLSLLPFLSRRGASAWALGCLPGSAPHALPAPRCWGRRAALWCSVASAYPGNSVPLTETKQQKVVLAVAVLD